MQTGLDRGVILAETQDDTSLLLIDGVEAHQPPNNQDDGHDCQEEGAGHTFAAGGPAAAAATTENSGELLLQLAHRFVHVRWALVSTAPGIARFVAVATRLVPGHMFLL